MRHEIDITARMADLTVRLTGDAGKWTVTVTNDAGASCVREVSTDVAGALLWLLTGAGETDKDSSESSKNFVTGAYAVVDALDFPPDLRPIP